MLKKLSDWIYGKAHGGLVLLFLGLQILYASFILPRFQPKNNEELLDLQLGFDKATAYRILESYGEAGRAEYIQFAAIWDILFPIIYTVFNVLLVSFLVRKSFPNNTKLRLLNLVPLISMVLDFNENFGNIQVTKTFPELSEFWVNYASTSGIIKWIFSGIGIAITIALLLSWLTKAVRRS